MKKNMIKNGRLSKRDMYMQDINAAMYLTPRDMIHVFLFQYCMF